MAKQLEVFHIYVGRLTHLISTLLNGHILLRREISKKKKQPNKTHKCWRKSDIKS